MQREEEKVYQNKEDEEEVDIKNLKDHEEEENERKELKNQGTSRPEFGQQMRSRELPTYLSLNRLLNGILSYS